MGISRRYGLRATSKPRSALSAWRSERAFRWFGERSRAPFHRELAALLHLVPIGVCRCDKRLCASRVSVIHQINYPRPSFPLSDISFSFTPSPNNPPTRSSRFVTSNDMLLELRIPSYFTRPCMFHTARAFLPSPTWFRQCIPSLHPLRLYVH